MAAVLIILVGCGIAGWLALLFIRRRAYEQGVVAFLSITLAPLVAWWACQWLLQDTYIGGVFYGTLADALPSLALVGVFAWLCILWARRGQQLSAVEENWPQPQPPQQQTQTMWAPTEVASADNSATFDSDRYSAVRVRLEALQKLFREGLLSEEEYAARRAQIIAEL